MFNIVLNTYVNKIGGLMRLMLIIKGAYLNLDLPDEEWGRIDLIFISSG